MGGLGLYITREFVKKFSGTLWVISGKGYWKEENNSIETYDMNNVFPGTIITIKLDLDDIDNKEKKNEASSLDMLTIEELLGGVI